MPIPSELTEATKIIRNPIVRNFIRQSGFQIARHSQKALKSIVNSVSQFKNIKEIGQAAEQLKRVIPKSEQTQTVLQDISNWTKTAKQTAGQAFIGGKGAAAIGALGTVAAGGAVAGAWAYPAKKLGEEIGTRIEEKKAGRRLRSAKMPFKEYAQYLPGIQTAQKGLSTLFQKLGQRIKQQYSQYNDIDDEELGQKISEKYPNLK